MCDESTGRSRRIRIIRRVINTLRIVVSLVTLFAWVTGIVIGILIDTYRMQVLAVGIPIAAVLLAAIIWDAVNKERASAFSEWERTLRHPDRFAEAAKERANEDLLVIGEAIEVLPHPNLNTRASLEELGWDPATVRLNDLHRQFDAAAVLEKAGGYREFDPPNGTKFALSGGSLGLLDAPEPILNLQRTDYFTIMSVVDAVENSPELRAEFGSLDARSNRIPHSLCLHFVVRFSGGDVLCMKRDRDLSYSRGLWSFSAEEQLSESDFDLEPPALWFFRRAFCEEVLPLREVQLPLQERWERASGMVGSMRLWSILLEERIRNFSLLGVCQLQVDKGEFVSLHNRLIGSGEGSRDREGKLFVVSHNMLMTLLYKGICKASGLFNQEMEEVIAAEDLHETSRYRLFRLLRAVYRRPLQMDTPFDEGDFA